ncbi:MAG: ammonium transporter [Myxococcales bacterium]|nr:ammonium transporter [Myxococcales bacterium]
MIAAGTAAAEEEAALSAGDTAWVLTSSALVLMMTIPGLALFYGGLVRSKNVLSVLMQCLLSAGWVTVVWVLVGYSIAFGGEGSVWGGLSKMGMSGIRPDTLRGTIPEYVFAMFQLMFAIITPTLMIGAFAERMRFSAWFAFLTLWLVLVYCPLAHMVWGDGGLIGSDGWGALDFAGGLVVHMSSGFSALVAALYLGKRRGFGSEPMPPHSLPFTVIGTALLWVGWFGFNAGSELAADGVAGLAFLTTQTAAATAVVGWIVIEWLHRGKPTVLGAATAAVAGLGAITPASAYVSPMGAMAVGIGAAVFSYAAVTLLKPAMGYDDSLDVFGVHGVGGTWGVLAAGIFTWSATGAGVDGQVFIQIKSIAFTAVFCSLMTLVILVVLKAVMGDLRVGDEEESRGLDLAEHSEPAYVS